MTNEDNEDNEDSFYNESIEEAPEPEEDYYSVDWWGKPFDY